MVENLKVMQQCPLRIAINNFLKKYNQIWKRVEKLLKLEFDNELVYGDNDKCIKIKIYGGMIINIHSKNIPKEKAPCKFLSIIKLDSVIKAKKKYYPQTLLEECRYKQGKIKMENLIDDDLEKSLSDESDSESDKDNDESNE